MATYLSSDSLQTQRDSGYSGSSRAQRRKTKRERNAAQNQVNLCATSDAVSFDRLLDTYKHCPEKKPALFEDASWIEEFRAAFKGKYGKNISEILGAVLFVRQCSEDHCEGLASEILDTAFEYGYCNMHAFNALVRKAPQAELQRCLLFAESIYKDDENGFLLARNRIIDFFELAEFPLRRVPPGTPAEPESKSVFTKVKQLLGKKEDRVLDLLYDVKRNLLGRTAKTYANKPRYTDVIEQERALRFKEIHASFDAPRDEKHTFNLIESNPHSQILDVVDFCKLDQQQRLFQRLPDSSVLKEVNSASLPENGEFFLLVPVKVQQKKTEANGKLLPVELQEAGDCSLSPSDIEFLMELSEDERKIILSLLLRTSNIVYKRLYATVLIKRLRWIRRINKEERPFFDDDDSVSAPRTSNSEISLERQDIVQRLPSELAGAEDCNLTPSDAEHLLGLNEEERTERLALIRPIRESDDDVLPRPSRVG